MILKNVDIRDFKSHRHTTIDFDTGILVIVGDNGSGKTSILDSVNFALFKQKPGVNADDLIRRGADSTEVSVTFIANGRTFRVTRGRKIGKAYGSVLYRIDGGEALIVKGEDEITREVEGILGVGGELFTSAIYIKQGEVDRLISARPAERKEHIGKLLGADELERAHQGMGELLKEYRTKAERLSSLPHDIKDTENAIEEKEGGLGTLKKELKKSSKLSASVKGELKDVQANLKDLEQLRDIERESAELGIRLKNLTLEIERIEEYEKELIAAQGPHDKYTAIEKEIKSLTEKGKRFSELTERGEGLRRELSSAEKRISHLDNAAREQFNKYSIVLGKKFVDFGKLSEYREKLLKQLENRRELIDKRIDNSTSKISAIKGKNTEIEKAIYELKKAGAECPVCQGPLDEKHKIELLSEYSQKIEKNMEDTKKRESSLEEDRAELENIAASLKGARSINVELLKSELAEREDSAKRAKKIKFDLKACERELVGLSKIEKLLQKNEKEKSALEKNNERYIAAKSYLRKYLPEKEEFQRAGKELEKRLFALGEKIERLGGPLDKRKFERLRRKESELQERFNDAQVNRARQETNIKHLKDGIKESKKRLGELKLKEKERKKLSKFLVLLEDIRRLFHKDMLQKDLRTRALPLIESYTKEIFDMFDLPYNDLELTDDFNVVLFSSQGEESVDMLSGGERIAAALALRMGIAKALSGSAMELIILDEPTIHLDSQRRQDLVEIIKKLSLVPQTIVVTHDKEFETAADRLIVVEKVNGISKIS